MLLHHPICLTVGHGLVVPAARHRNPLITVPGIGCGKSDRRSARTLPAGKNMRRIPHALDTGGRNAVTIGDRTPHRTTFWIGNIHYVTNQSTTLLAVNLRRGGRHFAGSLFRYVFGSQQVAQRTTEDCTDRLRRPGHGRLPASPRLR